MNVAGGNGTILSPTVLSCRWNLSRRSTENKLSTMNNLIFEIPQNLIFSLNNISCSDSTDSSSVSLQESFLFDNMWQVLATEGVVVINTPWSNQSPEVIDSLLLEFVRKLGCDPHNHSEHVGSIWDVRPFYDLTTPDTESTNTTAANPRSQTLEAFDMHTDCSFESPPPRCLNFHF